MTPLLSAPPHFCDGRKKQDDSKEKDNVEDGSRAKDKVEDDSKEKDKVEDDSNKKDKGEDDSKKKDKVEAEMYIKGGCKRVISAPSKDVVPICVIGVNHTEYKSTDTVVSNTSYITNCPAPPTKVMHERFGIIDDLVIAEYTTTVTQLTVGGPSGGGKDRRGFLMSAAEAIGKCILAVHGKFMDRPFIESLRARPFALRRQTCLLWT